MIIDPTNPKHITAEEGYEFQRVADDHKYGPEMYLGYTYYIGGQLVIPPHEDKYEDFREIPYEEPVSNIEVEA